MNRITLLYIQQLGYGVLSFFLNGSLLKISEIL